MDRKPRDRRHEPAVTCGSGISGKMASRTEGQHQNPRDLIVSNVTTILNDIINQLENTTINNIGNITDYAKYRIDWLLSLLLIAVV